MQVDELPKTYEPKGVEDKWYSFWSEKSFFSPDLNASKPPYSIVIPPPNVTGSLHMGHALNNTLQDILIRWKRMSGYNTLWIVGTDHAGIATQNVVERQLALEGKSRYDLGREKFIERVWQWRRESGGTIVHQLKRLGASCDWSRERFTMDEGLSRAVREVFVRLYEEGLIYRGNYIINWCPRCKTALSDLEVEHKEVEGKLYYIHYPLIGESGGLTIATTRPETMLGDTAVAVNPTDERYQAFIGKKARLPLMNRELPIIADPRVDKEFGTGALKITPAHDPVDFEIGVTHNLPRVVVINEDGKMTREAGKYQGLDRFAAREAVVKDLKAEGYLIKIEKYTHSIGHCYRCQTVVEPYLSFQWFVRMKELAEPAIEAVREGRIRIIPSVWEKTYYDWMLHIKDWCISRQIWWGHQIPAWFCQNCQEINVARETPERCRRCGSSQLVRETDVLDTWFSSALWPFSTLGWPDKTRELELFYPTSVLVTAFDILFFWVARMIMMGLKFCHEVPFRDVYIHALVRDAEGQKMSKSKGNVIDPLRMMDKYGTDAFRFTLAAFAAQGRDIRFSEERTEGYRNFVNKIWNASRFVLMNLKDYPLHGKSMERTSTPQPEYALADRWILSRLQGVIQEVNQALTEYKFNEYAHILYQFIWHEFCDWYIELAKPSLHEPVGSGRRVAAQYVLAKVLETTLRLLHPVMPFVTEEIWQKLPHEFEAESIMIAPFPTVETHYQDPEAEQKMGLLMGIIAKVRNIRSEVNLPPATKIELLLRTQNPEVESLLTEYRSYLSTLTKAENIQIGREVIRPEFSATDVYGGVEIFLPLKGLINITDELNRLHKEVDKIEKEIHKIEVRLSNPEFLSKAPPDVVEKEKARQEEMRTTRKKLEGHLQRLKELVS